MIGAGGFHHHAFFDRRTAIDNVKVATHEATGCDLADGFNRAVFGLGFLAKVALSHALANGVRQNVGRLDMGEVVTAQIGNGQFAEHVIKDRGCHFDGVVPGNHA